MAEAGGRESVEMISEAMGLDGTVTKTGYMHKTAMSGSRSQWRKRYFVLNGHQLLYYADHKNLGTKSSNAKGDFLLTADCYIEDCAKIGSHEHVFEVHSGTHTLRMSARTADERAAWKAAAAAPAAVGPAGLRARAARERSDAARVGVEQGRVAAGLCAAGDRDDGRRDERRAADVDAPQPSRELREGLVHGDARAQASTALSEQPWYAPPPHGVHVRACADGARILHEATALRQRQV